MKFVITILLGIAAFASPASAQGLAATYRSDHLGKRYDFQVTHSQLEASPDWADDAENPPLSPRKALAIAHTNLATFLPDADKWRHPKLTLIEVGAPHKWIYVIEFEGPLPPYVGEGPFDVMREIILMDGTAVKPIVAP